jgi:hypothetical protein
VDERGSTGVPNLIADDHQEPDHSTWQPVLLDVFKLVRRFLLPYFH